MSNEPSPYKEVGLKNRGIFRPGKNKSGRQPVILTGKERRRFRREGKAAVQCPATVDGKRCSVMISSDGLSGHYHRETRPKDMKRLHARLGE